MKRNKMRLVAVAMSAMLAAGMIPVGAYGEELTAGDEVAEAIIVEEPEVVDEAGAGYQIKKETMKWDKDTMKVDYQLENGAWLTATAIIDDEYDGTPKTCDQPTTIMLKAYIDEEWYHSEPIVTAKPTDHKWVDDEHVVDVFPNCTEPGEGRIVRKCSVCGAIDPKTPGIPEKLEAYGHKWSEEFTLKADEKKNTKLVNGAVVLVDNTMDGTYYEVYTCTNTDPRTGKLCTGTKEVEKTLSAQKVVFAEITAQKEIADNLVGMSMNQFRAKYPTDNDVKLKKCTEDGKYQVTYYDGNHKFVSQEWYTIAAHHMEVKDIEFASEADKNLCVVDGLKVVNNSCFKPVTYYEVTHCKAAANCPNDKCDTKKYVCEHTDYKEVSRVEKVAEPTGKHIINTEVKDEVNHMNDDKIADNTELARLATLADKTSKEGAAAFIKTTKNTATCEKDGEITVTFLCKVCGAEVESITLKTKKLEHKWGQAKGENDVAPTCTSEGSYDVVIKCELCGTVKEKKEGVKIPRLPHTNELVDVATGAITGPSPSDKGAYIVWVGDKVVDPKDGSYLKAVGQTGTSFGDTQSEFKVEAKPATNCTVCGQHEVVLDKNAKLEIVSVTKQGKTCEFGSITLKATYTTSDGKELSETKSFPYWSTMDSYRGRTGHVALPPVEEVWEDGTYVVIRCQICGEVLYSQKIKDAEGKEVKDGLVQDEDGVWRYYEDDKFAEEFTGIAPYNTGEFFVANGVLCSEANGLNEYNGKWYFLAGGQIQRGYNGFALYDGAWFIIKDGELDTTANGLFDYNGGKFLFAAGKLRDDISGLWQDADGTWYFLANGQVQTQFSGVAEYDGAFFVVKDGVFQADYNGTVEYDGHTFNVVKGQLYGEVAA